MSRIICLLGLIVFTLHEKSDTVLSGRIISNEEVVVGATVQLLPSKRGTVTDANGYFEFTGLQPDRYQMKVSAVGFVSKIVDVEVRESIAFYSINLIEDILNLQQVVVTATRSEVPVYEAPVVVSMLNHQKLDLIQALNLADGLSFSPGLRVENNCQNCGFTQVRMNGLDGPYTQILINSRPIFSALAGVYGLEQLPTAMIDRMEVVRGGGSVLFGGNAIAGTINIITKEPLTNELEIGSALALTDAQQPDYTFTLYGSRVSSDLRKGISFYGYRRHRTPWDANDDGFSELTKIQNITMGIDGFTEVGKRDKLKVGIYGIDEFRRGGSDFDRPPHQSEIAEQLRHQIVGINLGFEHFSADYRSRLSPYVAIQQVKRDSYYGGGGRIIGPDDVLTPDDLLALNAYGTSQDISVNTGLQYQQQMSAGLTFTVGSEFNSSQVNDEMPGYGREIAQKVMTWGNFVQLEINPIDKLTILTGLRYDWVNISGSLFIRQLSDKAKLFLACLSAVYHRQI